ncbi:flavin reductase family protein [Nocardia rhamnosiphila]|uniref:flavin reductase family protein n=1 Tax=Nocardia rhamnosiphila TaxID=426716 RepID=UPI00340DF536
MAAVCAPVTVVTTADDDGPHGATVSSLASLSLHPPLVSVALDLRSALLARIRNARRFGVNVLGFADDETALLFSRRGEDGSPRSTGASRRDCCDSTGPPVGPFANSGRFAERPRTSVVDTITACAG